MAKDPTGMKDLWDIKILRERIIMMMMWRGGGRDALEMV
jgi:hypothetical protein